LLPDNEAGGIKAYQLSANLPARMMRCEDKLKNSNCQIKGGLKILVPSPI
jgi:hypothetical protein